MRETKGQPNETIAARAGDGAVTLPTTLLVDTGTSGAAELFASALLGNKRAELIGEHTIGRAAAQKLIKLPDGTGLWLTTTRYLTPSGSPLHERGSRTFRCGRRARRGFRPARADGRSDSRAGAPAGRAEESRVTARIGRLGNLRNWEIW